MQLTLCLQYLLLPLQIYTTRAGKDVQEAQGVHKCWSLFISFLLILLFTSRTIYDLVAVKVEDAKKFGFGWTFATDMVYTRKMPHKQ